VIQLFRGDLYDKFGEQRLSLYQECVVPEDIHTPWRATEFRGEEGSKRRQFPRATGAYLQRFFPSGSE